MPNITVRLYKNYVKRRNKLETPPAAILYDQFSGVLLKSPETDPLHPVLIFTLPTYPSAYTYAFINAYSRYYFIENITTLQNGLYKFELSVDVLASYYSSIRASSHFTLRSATAVPNVLHLPDAQFTGKGIYEDRTDRCYLKDAKTYKDKKNRHYIVGIRTYIPAEYKLMSRGDVLYFYFDGDNFQALVNYLMGAIGGTVTNILDGNITEDSWLDALMYAITDDAGKAIIDPLKYIVSIIEYPFLPECFTSDEARVTQVPCGPWYLPSGITGYIVFAYEDPDNPYDPDIPGDLPINHILKKNSVQQAIELDMDSWIEIPNHPDYETVGFFVNKQFTKRRLSFRPFFDMLELNPDVMYLYNALTAKIYLDVPTGHARLEIILAMKIGNSYFLKHVIHMCEGNLGTEVSVTQLQTNALQGIASATSALVSGGTALATGNPALGIGALAEVGQAAQAISPVMNTSGSAGVGMSWLRDTMQNELVLFSEFESEVAPDIENIGLLVMEDRLISGNTGFVKVYDGYVDGIPTYAESDMVKSLLEKGIYVGTYTPPVPIDTLNFKLLLNVEKGFTISCTETGNSTYCTTIADMETFIVAQYSWGCELKATITTGQVNASFQPTLQTEVTNALTALGATVTTITVPAFVPVYGLIYFAMVDGNPTCLISVTNADSQSEDHQYETAEESVNRMQCYPSFADWPVSYPDNPADLQDFADAVLLEMTSRGITYHFET